MATSVTAPALAALLGDGWRRPGEASSALADALRGLVVDGRLAARTRIPSERALSVRLGVSRGSVSRAYGRLREDGFLVSARGAGSWLTLPAGAAAAPALPIPGDSDAERALDLTIAALPAPDPLLHDAVARASAALPRHLAGHGYAAAGLDELRAAIAAHLSARGLVTSTEEVLVTAGAQHALHLVLGLLVAPGDRVLVDAPAYPRTLAAIRGARARAVPVPLSATGWDADAWAEAARVASPRLAVTVPDFHNPTGLTMRAADRAALALTCARAGTVLVADETCAELRLDGLGHAAAAGAAGGASGHRVHGHHDRDDEQGGLGRSADRLDSRDRPDGARARGAARQRRHDEPGPRPACRGRAAARLGRGAGLPPCADAPAPRRALRRAGRARARLDGPPPPWRDQRLGPTPHARRDPPRRRGRPRGHRDHTRARPSRSTAPSSTTSACPSRCRPTICAQRSSASRS